MASNDYNQFSSINSFQTFSNIIPTQMFSKFKPTQLSQNPTPYHQPYTSPYEFVEVKSQHQIQPSTQNYQSQHNAYSTTDYIPINNQKQIQEPINVPQYQQPQKCDPKDPNCHMNYDNDEDNYDDYMIFRN